MEMNEWENRHDSDKCVHYLFMAQMTTVYISWTHFLHS